MKRVLVLGALLAAVVLAAAGGSARGAGRICPTSNPPNELVLAGGSGQQAQLGKQFAESLQVQLANTNGCPLTGNLAGVTVNFDAPGSGASGIFASSGSREAYVGTNSQGIATAPPFTANFTVGNYSVDAHSDYGTVEIGLSNTANGLPAAIAPQGSSTQEAAVNTQYAQPLQVRVTDANGAPVQGATVSFAVVPGATGAGASFLAGGQAGAVTNADGVATSPPLLANGVAGKFFATASTTGVSSVAMFALDNHAAAITLSMLPAADPTATVNTQYRDGLKARVVDANGQPLEGATVTFAIAAAGNGAGASFLGGGTQATALTDTDGRASSPVLVANKTAGAFTATAATTGAQPLAFTLTNLAATAYTVTAGAASGTATVVGTRFAVPLAVTVTDENGNPVKGAVVVFTAPVTGATGRFTIPTRTTTATAHGQAKKQRARRKLPRTHPSRTARVATNADGIAVAPPFTAGATAGGFAVTAAAAGTSKRAAFALIVTQP
jgi:protocatechuate 3,4-dioxygenase beta subunit